MDALPLVQTESGRRLVTWLLRHHRRYLQGAIDPDVRFRDFQNHFIHVQNGYWGGAPRVAHQWYDRLQRYLRTDRYSDAAHAAGVLSHYFTDSVSPLHTGLSARECLVHRPLDHSIATMYDHIYRTWQDDQLRIVMQLSDRPGWLGSMMLHAARQAHTHFETLINRYSFHEGVEEPAEGLDESSIRILSEVFGLAITGWARVLERAASDAETIRRGTLPTAPIIWPAVAAVATTPLSLWRIRVRHAKETLAVQELAAEYYRTGQLRHHVPAEVDIKHRVVAILEREERFRVEREQRRKDWARARAAAHGNHSDHDEHSAAVARSVPSSSTEKSVGVPLVPMDCDDLNLSPYDQMIHAPSIGARTAERFLRIHIHSVGQFLMEDPEQLAVRLSTYWIDAQTVRQWQAQATLMCQIPRLTGLDAQLLAGAGYQSARQLAICDARLVHIEVSRFALTTAGRRYLRGNSPPDLQTISAWVRATRQLRYSETPLRRAA
ncbi:DUF4332 domain-containing protein [Stieleria varia]